MRLDSGQFVVHPHHGPAIVLDRSQRKVKGEAVTYVTLEIEPKDLTISMPESKLKEVGVRPLASHTQVRKLMSLMQKPTGEMEEQWSRRLKAFGEKMASGESTLVAEVARDLRRRQQERDLSMAERTMYREAVDMLAAEVALVLDVSVEEAEQVMEQAIDGTPLTQLGLDRGKDSVKTKPADDKAA